MRTLAVLIGLCAWCVLPAYSQNVTIPQTEFTISTTDSLVIEKGSFEKIPVWVLRSKAFAGRNVKMGVSSTLPDGVVVNFQPQSSYFDLCETMISVNPNTQAGQYHIIVSGSTQSKTKGKIIKLIVVEPSMTMRASK